jgi:hypothetical protein
MAEITTTQTMGNKTITTTINTAARGPQGEPGTDANVTQANIEAAITDKPGFREEIGTVATDGTGAEAAAFREAIAVPELRGIDRLVNYRTAVYNAGAYRRPNILFFGDSMIGTAIATLRGQLESYGELSGWGLLPGVLVGGATIESDACVKWINGETWLLNASGEGVEFAYNGSSAVEGDTLKIYHLRQPGGGTFKIQSSVDGAAYVDEGSTIDTNGALAGVVTTVTKATYAKTYKVRALWVSGAVNIIGGGILDSKRFGPIVSFVTNGSTGINNIDNASTTARAITDPIFADIAPNLIVLSHLDGAANVTTYQGTLQDNIAAGVVSTGAPAPSWLIVGPPIGDDDTQDALNLAQQQAMRTLADSREDSFYDNRTWALPVADVVSRGLITDGTHYTAAAQLQWIPSMFREIGIFDHTLYNRNAAPSYDLIAGGTFRGNTSGTPTYTQTATTHVGSLRLENPAGGINQCFLTLSDMAGAVNANDAAILQYASNVFILSLGAVSAFNWRNNAGQYESYPTDTSLNSRNGITAARWGVTYTGGLSTSISTKSTAYTATEKDRTLLCNAASAGFTVTIPAAAAGNNGLMICIKKIDATANAVTIGTTVDGVASPTITTQWDRWTIQSDGSAWYRIG